MNLSLLSQELERRKECFRTSHRIELFPLARMGIHEIGSWRYTQNSSDQAWPGGLFVDKDLSLQNQGTGGSYSAHREVPVGIRN